MANSNRFHLYMVAAALVLLASSVIGCLATSIHVDPSSDVITLMVALSVCAPLPIWCNEKGKTAYRETSLVIAWMGLILTLLSYPILIAAKLRMPLQDAHFAMFDKAVGVNVPAIVHWAADHRVGQVVTASYGYLAYLLLAAIFIPVFAGRVATAREFLLANVISFAVGIPLFALLPSIGPWVSGHFAANQGQVDCQTLLMALRVPGQYVFLNTQGTGIVAFPSFHAIWAVLSARALWGFRWLRIPAVILAIMIVLSTMTLGWHYFADVLAGLVLSTAAILLAKQLCATTNSQTAELIVQTTH